jgi:hypothetical protein
MEPERRQKMLLGLLVVLLAGYAVYWFLPGPATPETAASNVRTAAGVARATASITAPDVHLEALESERPKPSGAGRNLFRFQAKAAPPVERAPVRDPGERPVASDAPAPGPTVSPIALKFLGVMEVPERSLRVAVLSDGRGVYRGVEGDIIEGRYRIVHIGTESIEMTHLDGSGRQVIRLSGS